MLGFGVQDLRGIGEGGGAGGEVLGAADVGADADAFELAGCGEEGGVGGDGPVGGEVDVGHGDGRAADGGDGGAEELDVFALVGGELVAALATTGFEKVTLAPPVTVPGLVPMSARRDPSRWLT